MRNRIKHTIANAEGYADYTMRVEGTKTVLYRCLCELIEIATLQQRQIVRMRRKLYRLGKKFA